MLIGIVGPCSSGKSTLAKALRGLDYHVKEIMQEHCSAPDMWLRLSKPDVLIYLDVDEATAAQREGLSQPSSWWKDEREVRLAHARTHCHIYVDTTPLTPLEVFSTVKSALVNLTKTEPSKVGWSLMMEHRSRIPVIAFVGRSGCGKTTLLENVVPVLLQRDIRVAVVKHTQHRGIQSDVAGTDTKRMWDLGTPTVVLVTPDRVVQWQHRAEPALDSVLANITDVDVIILEGFKNAVVPKIEVLRQAHHAIPLPGLDSRIAYVTDIADLLTDIPCFSLNDFSGITDFIIQHIHLPNR